MDFAYSKLLLLLWLVPIALLLVVLEMRHARQRMQSFAATRLSELMTGVWSAPRLLIKSLLVILSLAFVILALARPRWGFEWRDLPRGGTDIVIALDLSSSMMATDISPNRLERAKREIIDLLGLLKGDRIGIVAFAGVSFVYTPLTVDYRLADMFIKQLDIKMMPVQGTAIGEALKQSIEALEKASSSDTQGKAIILITDGEDQGTEALAAAKQAKEKGVRIFTVGIGSEAGAPIPMPDGGFKKDKAGNIIVSKIDEKTLQAIAAESGGAYVRSSSGNLDLDLIYQNIRGSGHEREGELSRQKIWHERFQIFLVLAFILLLIEFFLRSSRPKKTRPWWTKESLVVLFGLAFLAPQLKASDQRDGQKAFEKKDYKTATEKFLNAEIRDPNTLQHAYNRAVSQYHDSQFKEAVEGFAKAAQSPDKSLAQRSFYNLGNAQVGAGNLEEAAKAFEKALELNAQDKEAQENLAWTKKKIEEQKQKQEQKKENDKQKDDQKKEDEKKDDQKKDSEKKEQEQQQKNSKDDQKKGQEKENKEKKSEEDQKSKSEESKNEDSKEEQKDAQKEEQGKPSEKNEAGEGKAADKKEMTREEAEKLLRMMEDQEQVFGMPQQQKSKQSVPERDW